MSRDSSFYTFPSGNKNERVNSCNRNGIWGWAALEAGQEIYEISLVQLFSEATLYFPFFHDD